VFDTAIDFYRVVRTEDSGGSTVNLGSHYVAWGDPELHSGLLSIAVAAEEPVNIGDIARILHTPPTL